MKSRTLLVLLILALVAAVGCQPKNSKKARISRAPRGDGPTANAPGTAGAKTTWGEVTRGGFSQTSFWNQLYYFTYPQLSSAPEEDQLGYVSGESNQTATGVRFWGHAKVAGNQIDAETAELDIYIYDDRVGKPTSDGGTRPAIRIHMGSHIQGFVGFTGTYGTTTTLTFTDQLGSVRLSGQINGDYFEGDMSFTNLLTGSSNFIPLGRFKVKKSGFFE